MMIDFFVFLIGACVGSFLNVCIHRIPRDETVVHGRSHCTTCGKQIAWHDNVPLLSYAALLGKCRYCKQAFSFRYFVVEALTGGFWVLLWRQYGVSEFFLAGIILFSILVGIAFTDFETGYIPDKFNFFGLVCGVILSAVFPSLHQQFLWYNGLGQALAGLFLGGGILFLIGQIGAVIYKQEAMGGGDIKMLAMLGVFLGIKKTLLVLFFAPIFSMPIGLYLLWVKKEKTIRFGPYISIAAAFAFVYGEAVWNKIFYIPF